MTDAERPRRRPEDNISVEHANRERDLAKAKVRRYEAALRGLYVAAQHTAANTTTLSGRTALNRALNEAREALAAAQEGTP
jgi:hypothetical protein